MTLSLRDRDEFVYMLRESCKSLLRVHDFATDKNEWYRAKFIQNAIDQLNALIHIEEITKMENSDDDKGRAENVARITSEQERMHSI